MKIGFRKSKMRDHHSNRDHDHAQSRAKCQRDRLRGCLTLTIYNHPKYCVDVKMERPRET